MRAIALLFALLAPAALAAQGRVTKDAPRRAFDVAVLGDMPYVPNPDTGTRGAEIMREYAAVLAGLSRSGTEMVVHVGDITGWHCADSVMALRRADFDALPQPMVLVVGDNEWIDCGRAGYDPLERLALVRSRFMAGDSSLGRSRIRLHRQSESAAFAEMRENVRWVRGGVMFMTLHVVPIPDRYRSVPAQAREHARRDSANIAWLRESFAEARARRLRGVAVFLQANLGWGAEPLPEFVGVRSELAARAAEFGREVAVVHGDSHRCRVDRPVVDAAGRPLLNVVRAETFGNPRHHWLRMHVTPAADTLFHFVPEFVTGNAPATCQVHGRLVTPPAAPAAR